MAGRQFVFDLPHDAALTRADFVAAPANREALGWIERWPDWPGAALSLYGPAGAGKTHLAQIWRARSFAAEITPEIIGNAALPGLLRDARAVLIDGADRAAEEALLHLYNMLAERGGHLLLVSREPPARREIALADLRSRLVAAPAVGVAAPDEELIATVLTKLFADRRLAVPREVVTFLALRLERSFAAAEDAASRLDRAALSAHRPITVPLARQVLFGEDAALL
ncbi:MAG TPA: DnaA/Hda family protein [Stellaceae bacterium]|nr:DnaA/Hda family protein [Stellaceae bacterium]